MRLTRAAIIVLLLTLTASAASAYTVVMRDGRRVEIPNQFTVTKTTLTYEVRAGIQVTIQLASVDIAATEKANNEPKGSLLLKGAVPPVVQPAPQKPQRAERSITNKELEPYKQTRLENELAYEERRKELGLPSLEEQRRELAEVEERTQEQLRAMRSQEQTVEAYWRGRASALRTEMAATQAQIDFVRRRLDEIPPTYSFGALTTTIPFGTVATPRLNFPVQNLLTPNVFAPTLVTSGFGVNTGINSGQRLRPFGVRSPRTGVNRPPRFGAHPGQRFNRFPGRGRRGFSTFGHGALLAIPFQTEDFALERTELVNQLNELEIHRAGLQARWREFEDEARRAGAYPGWLRP
jgi:hypothetical protein